MPVPNSRPAAPLALLALAAALAACGNAGAREATRPGLPPGSPLPGLRAAELARFREGEALFEHVYTPAEGLGPLFNENQCSACHTSPASGGTGEQLVVKMTRFTPPGRCDLLSGAGGENVRSQATPLLVARGISRQPAPRDATENVRLDTPFLFGIGAVAAIPERELVRTAEEEPHDARGRLGRTADGRTGRFGRKADVATLREFVESALRFEMGLTSPGQPTEAPAGFALPPGTNPHPAPDVDGRTVDALTAYVRFLAPLPQALPADPGARQQAQAGESLFRRIGCEECHTPALRTGRSDVPALDRKVVRLYSDLLLHDMGPALAGTCAPGATPTEYRTEMLMGLRYRRRFLHDGRAYGVREAIEAHGGQAAETAAAFRRLTLPQQLAVLKFLDTL